MPKKIAGNVYWIENSRQTSRVVDVKEAFSDPAQAKAQVLYAESSGNKKQLILARLAYRQFLGKRYRVESKTEPRRATEVDQQRISKPSRKKSPKAKSSKKVVGRGRGRKAVRKSARRKAKKK